MMQRYSFFCKYANICVIFGRNRFERDVFRRGNGGLFRLRSRLFLELAVDGYVGILVETRVGFETLFGLGTAFEDPEIMAEETDPPFQPRG